MNRRQGSPRHDMRVSVALAVTAMALTACSSPTATTPNGAIDNVKLPIDNGSYTSSPAPLPTGSVESREASGGKPAASAPAPGDAPSGPMPEVTVTVTAQPTMDPATQQPALLRIPSFDVSSEVIRVGQDASGGVVVPEDISVTGWYDGSSWIDAPFGSIVLVGHRDSAVDGAGALYGIEELQIGDSIVLAGQDGQPHRFRVREIKSVEKTRFSSIVEDVFRPDSPYRLTLITCGGAFDESEGSYLSNIIVTAYPEQ